MTAFRYVAISPAGQTVRGTMDAASEAEVVTRLQETGNIPMRAETAGGGWRSALHRDIGRRGLTRQAVADVTRELSIMLGAGQDLDRSLRFLSETAGSNRLRTTIDALRSRVRDGGSFAAALADHPHSFPTLYVGLVRAGEAGGNLAPTLARLAALLERERALASTVTSALIYPVLLLIGATLSIVLLLTKVLPQFVPLFEQNGTALPGPTRMLIGVGAGVSEFGPFALACAVLLGVALQQARRRPGPRLAFDRLILRLPVLGPLAREVMAARFTQTLGTLLSNGVPLLSALTIVREVIGNRAGEAAVEQATISVKAGAGLSGPLGESRLFPPRTVHLLRLGEETAQLGAMALRAAEIHEEKVRLGVQRLVSLLVPVITVVMGAVILAIVSALLLAMLGLNDLAV